jgi:hypothetical protein
MNWKELPAYAYVVPDYEGKIKYCSSVAKLNSKNNAEMDGPVILRSANSAVGTSGLATCAAIIFILVATDGVIAHSIAHDSMFFSDECYTNPNAIKESCSSKLDCIKQNLEETLKQFQNKFKAKPSEIERIDVLIIGGATYEVVDQNTKDVSKTRKKAAAEAEILGGIINKTPQMRLAAYIPYLNYRYNEDDTASVMVKVTKNSIHIIIEDYMQYSGGNLILYNFL